MVLRANKPIEPPGRSLWLQIVVRHRAPGHLRFDLPIALCSARAVQVLESGLMQLDGVRRVVVFPSSRKLSIRWTEEICSLAQVVKALAALVDTIGVQSASPAATRKTSKVAERIKGLLPMARWRARYSDLKAKASIVSQIIAIKTGRPPPRPANVMDWGINFANDLVVFYLVRLHWHRISKQWLLSPWSYRYQWLAVIYLTFLLVRYRKAKRAKAEAELPPPCCGGV